MTSKISPEYVAELLRQSDFLKDPYTLYKTEWELEAHQLLQSAWRPPESLPEMPASPDVVILDPPPSSSPTQVKVERAHKRKLENVKGTTKRQKMSVEKLENKQAEAREKIAGYDREIQKIKKQRSKAYREYDDLSEKLQRAYAAQNRVVTIPKIVTEEDFQKKLTVINKQFLAALKERASGNTEYSSE